MSEIDVDGALNRYSSVRDAMKPGDVIAFCGKGMVSGWISNVTKSNVSHVGVILQTKVLDDDTGRHFNQIIESTKIDDFSGVNISRFSDRVRYYDGEIWWLPMRPEIQQDQNRFNQKAFYDFLFDQAEARKRFDVWSARFAAERGEDGPVSEEDDWFYNDEDFSKFFCSELVAAGLEVAGTTGCPINASEVTPIDLCRWDIYEDHYFQIKGDETKKISRYNSQSPEGWAG